MVKTRRAHLYLLLACAVLATGCSSAASPRKPRQTTAENVEVTEDTEKRLRARAEEEIRVIDRSGSLYEDRELGSYVNDIARRLLSAANSAPSISVKIIKSPDLNAFALLTGRLYINTGILAAMDSEAQLAALLGHEIVHVTRKHLAKEITTEKEKSENKIIMPILLGSYGEYLGQLSIRASVQGYSRHYEAEADTEGLKLAVQAGYEPSEAPKLFELLREEAKRDPRKTTYVYSSHPKIEDRIRSYTSLLSSTYRGRQGIKNTDDYRQHIMRMLLDNAELDLKRGNHAGADRAINRYLEKRPGDARAHYLLGRARAESREPEGQERAEGNYRRSISLKKDYPEPYRELGLLKFKQGKKQEATKHLQVYLSLRPDAPDREYIQQYIRECR